MAKSNYDKDGNWNGYVVYVGLPGYLPNSVYYAGTLGEAKSVAKEEARAFRDAGYTVTGNARDGYHVHQGEDDDWQRITIDTAHLSAKEVAALRVFGEWYD